ncbi:hypothetical protein CTAYLR_005429 [Chrysophaeum taylorii]|uniref:WW domain-containing protein n=1 Tax=Chrysophaeum taylorii TaxID=2483200 RepID=A0AAD7ULB9_9STRA|nr:hypothetical protein CTAYLR_005429 [Chrysophaeum taylorii]
MTDEDGVSPDLAAPGRDTPGDEDAINGECAKRKRDDEAPGVVSSVAQVADARDEPSARARRSRWNAPASEALNGEALEQPTNGGTHVPGGYAGAGGGAGGGGAWDAAAAAVETRARQGLGYGGPTQIFMASGVEGAPPSGASAAQSSLYPGAAADASHHLHHDQRPSHRRETVHCPQALVGRLIGKQGETIKDLQRRSGARIQIDQNYPEGQPRLVTIEGDPQSVQAGVELVTSLIGNSPAVGNGAVPGKMTTFECPKSLVGRVIGKGGETINELQRRSGARIQIEQRVPEGAPCIIEVQGDDAAIQEAIRLTQEVMSGKRLDTAASLHAGPAGVHAGYQQMMMQYPAAYGYPGMPRPMQHGGYAYPYGQPAYGGVYAPPGAYGAYGAWPVNYGQQQPQQQKQQPQPGTAGGAPAAATARADAWSSHSDGQGRTYWHNSLTGESTWHAPPGR